MATARRPLLALVAVGVVGVVVGALLFPKADPQTPPPADAPAAAPPVDLARPSRIPGQRAAPTPRSSNDLRQQGPAAPEPPPATAEELARWQAEEPVALHAVRDAARWREMGARLEEQGLPELKPQAESVAMRLERAMSPRPSDEITALLVEEIELLRTIVRAGVAPEVEALAQSIEQGAHHAIQGAPTPEMLEAQRREQQRREQQGTTGEAAP